MNKPSVTIPRKRPVPDDVASRFEASADAEGRSTATARRADTAKPAPGRRGSAERPHVRADGVETRAVTVHLPVELARQLRVEAAEQGVSVSRLIEQRLQQS